MKLENAIRILAGTMVLISLALAHWVSPWWLLLAAFVSVNLIQSAFTGFCPAEIILKKLGVGGQCCQPDRPAANKS
jgi:Inner membrane protein YgaP-like, transmembrane domain